MTINDAGLALIREYEGFRARAYRCPAGILTLGYGHTTAAGAPRVVPGMTVTEPEAAAILRRDLATYEAAVSRLVRVPLTANQHAALVSLTYNIGPANLAKSTLLRRLNVATIAGRRLSSRSGTGAAGACCPASSAAAPPSGRCSTSPTRPPSPRAARPARSPRSAGRSAPLQPC